MNIQDTVVVAGQSSSNDADDRVRVSALIDGELDPASIDATLDALLASGDLMRFWLDAHRAGDWMRSEEVVELSDIDLALRRFSLRLAEEPAIVAPKRAMRPRSAGSWMRAGLPGASIVAALVAVAWVATPFWRGSDSDSKKEVAMSSDVSNIVIAKVNPSAEAEARSASLQTIDSDRLSPYLAAHRDVTPFAYRGPSARPAAFNAPASSSALSALQ